ncbi:MAG: rhomboid family intramembrane serine protease [Candidatus Hodarchaeales archaeon]|jgi:membrane associated rhomboid family serine protease
MSLLKPLLFKKDMLVPWGTILFGLSSLIITFPLLLDYNGMKIFLLPNLERFNVLEFVKYFACQFGHGGRNLPSWIHLFTNLLNLVIMGVIVERVIGTSRFIIMCFLSSFFVTIYILTIPTVGFGSSGMLYSFWIFIVIIIYKEWKIDKRKALKDPLFLFTAIMSIWAWTVTIIMNIDPQANDIFSIFGFTNTVHLIGTTTGVLCLLIWKKPFLSNLGLIENQKEAQLKHQEVNHNLRVGSIVFFCLFLVFNVILSGYTLIKFFF